MRREVIIRAFFSSNCVSSMSVYIFFSSILLQMNLMANAGSYGGPYSHSSGQGLPGEGLGPQLQNKTGLPNNMAAQFNMDKKTPPGQGLPGMVGFGLRLFCIEVAVTDRSLLRLDWGFRSYISDGCRTQQSTHC